MSEDWKNPFIFSKKYWRYLPLREIPYVSAMYYYIIYVKENRRLRTLEKSIDRAKNNLLRKSQEALMLLKLRRAGSVVIFGASMTGEEYLNKCKRMGVKIEYFIDNNPLLHGKQFMGVPVFAPSQVLEGGSRRGVPVLLASRGRRTEMRRGLVEMGYKGDII